MDIIDIIQFLVNNIFSVPAFLVGIIVLIGLIVQRKRFPEVISGTVKTMCGFIMITIGASVFIEGLTNFQTIVSAAFRLPSPTYTGMGLNAFIERYGGYAR